MVIRVKDCLSRLGVCKGLGSALTVGMVEGPIVNFEVGCFVDKGTSLLAILKIGLRRDNL